MGKFRVISSRFVIPIVVVSVLSLAAPSSALGQLHLWRATAAVPAGISPDDALFVFTGTGGTIAGVAWNAAGATCPAPAAIVPSPAPGVANEVDITWAANIPAGCIVSFIFNTATAPVVSAGVEWTKGGEPIDTSPPEDVVVEEIAIPTVSEWGMIVMVLLALTAGTVVFARWRRPTVA